LRFSAYGLAFASVVVVGCQGGAEPQLRRIVPHALTGCEIEDQKLLLAALGDFDTPRVVTIDAKGRGDVDLPLELRGVEASTRPAMVRGVGYADPPEDIDLAMWSTTSACSAVPDYPIPDSAGGQAITAFDDGAAVIVAGLEPPTGGSVSNSAFAMVWDARTGERLALQSLKTRRVAWASATPFGKGALIAGGVDRAFFPARHFDTAVVFRDGVVQEAPLAIGDARSQHGAVVVANGATLLVGGENERGVIDTLATVTPSDLPPYGTADLFMLGSLAHARKRPAVMRLANDEILVAGGVDASDAYVSTLEWFSKEGRTCASPPCFQDPSELASAVDWSFVALEGGGALAAGGTLKSNGAPNLDVVWIGPHGAGVQKLPSLSPQQRGTKRVHLVAAGDASPWLWNGDAWFRFDPWQSAFVAPEARPDGGPDADFPAPIAVDSGLFMWIARKGVSDGPDDRDALHATLRGFRYDVRGPYAIDPEFLLADPRHLAPSEPPRQGGALFADAAGLHLTEGTSIVIADTTYGDVVITGETPNATLPAIAIGDFDVGTLSCPWPAAGTTFTVTRTDREVIAQVGDQSRRCNGPAGRVKLGLRGLGREMTTVKRLAVRRR
jgi:hypothetical protein